MPISLKTDLQYAEVRSLIRSLFLNKIKATHLSGFSLLHINRPFSFCCFSVCVNGKIVMIQYSYGTENYFTEDLLCQRQWDRL